MLNLGAMGGAGGMAQGALQVSQGIFAYRGATKQARIQRELNDAMNAFNKRQIERTYKRNYAKMMTDYADARGAIQDDYKKNQSQITVMAQQMSMNGIDVDGSSFYENAKSELKNELQASVNRLIGDQQVRGDDMFLDLIKQEFGQQTSYNENSFNIATTKGQSQNKAFGDIVSGAANVTMGGMDMMQSSKLSGLGTSNMTNQFVRSPQQWFNNFSNYKNPIRGGTYKFGDGVRL